MEDMVEGQGDGCHIQIHEITAQLVSEMHSRGKIVAVWIDTTAPADLYEENDHFYLQLYELGVDMITTDHPLRAEEAFKKFHFQGANLLSDKI
jgi:glycerophosphoryl diester phosphodiesterase